MGIDCGISTPPKQCPCNHTNTKRCTCGFFGQCLGDECHSIECTRIGLTECACSEPETSCRVCCYLNFTHKCVPANEATYYIYKNLTLLQILQNHEWYNTSENLLHDQSLIQESQYCVDIYKNDCYHFENHFWPIHDFCVYKGNLGECSVDGKCLTVPSYKQISPRFAMLNLQNDAQNHGRMLYSIYYYTIFNIILFILML